MLDSELILLQLMLDEYELIHRQIKQLEEVIEGILLETDCGILLSMPGLGITTAAELTAEIGNVHDFTHPGQLIQIAGKKSVCKTIVRGNLRVIIAYRSKAGLYPFRESDPADRLRHDQGSVAL